MSKKPNNTCQTKVKGRYGKQISHVKPQKSGNNQPSNTDRSSKTVPNK